MSFEDRLDKKLAEIDRLSNETYEMCCKILEGYRKDRVKNARRFDKIEQDISSMKQDMAEDRRENARRFDKIEDTLVQIINRLP